MPFFRWKLIIPLPCFLGIDTALESTNIADNGPGTDWKLSFSALVPLVFAGLQHCGFPKLIQ